MTPTRLTILCLSFELFACGHEAPGVATATADTSTGEDPTGAPVLPTGEAATGTDATSTTGTNATTGGDDGAASSSSGGSLCGDGVLDPGEGCDDGPANKPHAACTDECQPNVCGDGKVLTGVEACDEGADNLDTGACRSDCRLNVCGDGFLLQGSEECDAGPANGPVYGQCDEACTLNRCGDGTLDVGFELCDMGEANGSGLPGEDGMSGCDDECGFDGRWLFLSSMKFTGAMGTRAGADLACQNMAEAAGHKHPERFVALLADALGSPNTYVQPDPQQRPFILPSGLVLADSYEDLIAEGPGFGVTSDEAGDFKMGQLVWTNVNPFGDAYLTEPMSTCTSWSSAEATQVAQVGLNALPADDPEFATWQDKRQWLSIFSMHCEDEYRIYCIEAHVE